MKYLFGALPSPRDDRDYIRPVTVRATPLPVSFRLPFVPVKDQTYIGACVAFGATTAKENEAAGDHKQGYTRLSEGWLYGNGYGDSSFHTGVGSYPRQILQQLQKWGAPAYTEYSEYAEKPDMVWKVSQDISNNPKLLDLAAQHRIGRYYTLGINSNTIKEVIYDTKAPVGFVWSVRGYSLALDNEHCIVPQTGELRGYHYMVFDGWDDDKQVLYGQNSWGEGWGNKGRFAIRYRDIAYETSTREGMTEVWAIDTEPPKNILRMKIGSKKYTVEDGIEKTITAKEMDVACYLDANDRTMVPIRFVAEALGAEVEWCPYYYGVPKKFYPDRSYVRITDKKYGADIRFTIGSTTYSRQIQSGDNMGFQMDTTPVYDEKAGRVFVPVRYVVNALQGIVEWVPEHPDDIIIRF